MRGAADRLLVKGLLQGELRPRGVFGLVSGGVGTLVTIGAHRVGRDGAPCPSCTALRAGSREHGSVGDGRLRYAAAHGRCTGSATRRIASDGERRFERLHVHIEFLLCQRSHCDAA